MWPPCFILFYFRITDKSCLKCNISDGEYRHCAELSPQVLRYGAWALSPHRHYREWSCCCHTDYWAEWLPTITANCHSSLTAANNIISVNPCLISIINIDTFPRDRNRFQDLIYKLQSVSPEVNNVNESKFKSDDATHFQLILTFQRKTIVNRICRNRRNVCVWRESICGKFWVSITKIA